MLETWFGDFPGAGDPPDAAIPALTRLDAAGRAGRGDVSKVPRASLKAWVMFLRHNKTPKRSGFRAAVRKLETRLAAGMGPPPTPDLWESRARDAARVAGELRRGGRPAADREIEAAMGWQPGVLRKWRNHKPGLFPPAA